MWNRFLEFCRRCLRASNILNFAIHSTRCTERRWRELHTSSKAPKPASVHYVYRWIGHYERYAMELWTPIEGSLGDLFLPVGLDDEANGVFVRFATVSETRNWPREPCFKPDNFETRFLLWFSKYLKGTTMFACRVPSIGFLDEQEICTVSS